MLWFHDLQFYELLTILPIILILTTLVHTHFNAIVKRLIMRLNLFFSPFCSSFINETLYNNFHMHTHHNIMVEMNDVIIIFSMWLVPCDLMDILLINRVNEFSWLLIWLIELSVHCLKKNIHMKCFLIFHQLWLYSSHWLIVLYYNFA